jgi:hypothetical protein
MRVIGYVIAALLAAVCAANAATDDLSVLYSQVLQRPVDSETNLRYARAAEAAGKLRWAYAAYERVALNDPANLEAQQGLVRVARRLQPSFTEFLLQAGVSYESNPLYVPTSHTPEAQVFGTLGVKDERTVGDLRWRTTGLAAGIDHTRADQLNYAYVGATTGPVFDFIGGSQLHLAAGGGGAYFDQHPWYGEAIARATIEANAFGAAQSVAFRVAFRDYDSFFPAGQGWYWDVIGRFVAPGFLDWQNTLIFSPWVKRGDAPGTIPVSLLQPGVEPANYIEGQATQGRDLSTLAPLRKRLGLPERRPHRTVPAGARRRAGRTDVLCDGALVRFEHCCRDNQSKTAGFHLVAGSDTLPAQLLRLSGRVEDRIPIYPRQLQRSDGKLRRQYGHGVRGRALLIEQFQSQVNGNAARISGSARFATRLKRFHDGWRAAEQGQ